MGPELIRDGECHDVGGARWVAREPMLEARMGCRGTNEVATVLRCEADRVGAVHRNGAAGCAFNTLSQIRSSAGTLQGGVSPLHGPSFWTTSVEGALI